MSDTENRSYVVSITNKTIFRAIVVAIVALLVFRFARSVSHYLILISVAAFVALALNPYVDWMHKTLGGGRLVAVALSYITLFVILGSFLTAIMPSLTSQTVNFINDVPANLQRLKTEDSTAGRFARRVKITDDIDNFTQNFSSHTQNISAFALNVAGRVTSAIVSIIAVLVLAFMMLTEGPRLARKFWQLQTARHRNHYKPLVDQMYGIITGYVNGQLLISLIGAAISLITLLLIGVPNALVLAGIIFLTGLIPLVGHPIGAAAVTLIALFSSVDKALIVGIFYIVYLQVQTATIQPYIQAKANDMTPLTVFIAAILGIAAGGFLGAFIAIPLAGCARILFLDYMRSRRPA